MKATTIIIIIALLTTGCTAVNNAVRQYKEQQRQQAQKPQESGQTQQPPAPTPQQTTQTAKPPANLTAEQKEFLDYHNELRRQVGVPALVWSAELARYAQEWAEKLAREGCNLKHRERDAYGENCYGGWGGERKFIDAAKSWAEEKRHYTGYTLNAQNWSKAGHYTQMVWRTSTSVGAGIARCPGGGTIVVANYNPAGNMQGQKPY